MQGSGGFRLVVRRGPQPNQVYELNRDIMTLGRDASNEISINDPEVSRHHCRFTRVSGSYTLEDLGSTNGSFVNGQRLIGARPLASGDTIGLGETVTLVYEAVGLSMGGPPPYAAAKQATMIGGAPQPGYGAPPPGAPGYYQQPVAQPGYAPPPGAYPQQQPGYTDYPEEYEESGGVGRWIFLACGVFMVLCIITSVIAIILIDQSCAWDNIPVVSDIVDAMGYTVNEAQCQ
jgi:hypothetical protein